MCGGVKCSRRGGGTVDLDGVAGIDRAGDCNGLVDCASMGGDVELTSVASCLAVKPRSSCDVAVIGSFTSSGIDVRSGNSTRRGVSGEGADSVSVVDGTTGLGGQLLTPPACTVLHQGQRTGSALAAGAGG